MNYIEDLVKFGEYLGDYVAPTTLHVYTYALSKWFDTLNGGKPTKELAQHYVDVLSKTRSPSTTNLRAHAIMRYFKWKGTPISLDCPTIRMSEPNYLTMDQLGKVLASCNTILEKTLITVLFDTGVRISELLNLRLSDIDQDYKLITVVRKGGRKEDVNISDKGLAVLGEWLDARKSRSEAVFMDLSYHEAWMVIRNVGKKAKIPLHPHLLRHSRAVQMLKAGAPPYIVQGHLGHASITTTMNIYGKFRAIDIKENIPLW